MTDLSAVTVVERLVIEADRVIMRGNLGRDVVLDVTAMHQVGVAELDAAFERVYGTARNDWHLAAEDYYQGVNVMAVIRRRSDSRLFGYQYWTSIAKNATAHVETNGDEHGFADQWDAGAPALAFPGERPVRPEDALVAGDDDPFEVYVWLPVEPFTITGYHFTQS